MSDTTEKVLATTLDRLLVSTTLTQSQADAVAHEFAVEKEKGTEPQESSLRSSVLAEVGGYVGAIFVVAGVAALVAPNWDDLTTMAKMAALAGPGLLLAVFAVVVALATPGGWSVIPADHNSPRRRLVSVLALAASGLLAGAVTVVAEDQADWVFPLTLLGLGGIGYLLGRGVVLHLATAWALGWTVLAAVNPSFDDDWRVSGAILVLAGAGWAALSLLGYISEKAIGIIVAGAMAFTGAELIASGDLEAVGYLVLATLAVIGLAGYLRTRQLSALGVGAVALAVVVPQALIDYTEGSFGPAGGLLICGLSIVGASALSLRLRKSVDEAHRPPALP